MADATVQNILDDARSHLGDDQVAGGEVFTNTVLLAGPFGRAYREMYRTLAQITAPRVRREVFHVVPANTDILYPASANIQDFSEPLYIGERGGLTVTPITGATGTATVSITASSHGRTTGDLATVNGIVGFSGTEGMWGLTVTNSNVVVLNGAIGSGTYTSGGSLVYSGEEFTEVIGPKERFASIQNVSSGGKFSEYVWREGALHFPSVDSPRQLRIEYLASGVAPTSTTASIGIDDSRDLLAVMTAAYAGGPRGRAQRRMELLEEAFGPSRMPDGSGGLMYAFLNQKVMQMQRTPTEDRRRQPFRDPLGPNTILSC